MPDATSPANFDPLAILVDRFSASIGLAFPSLRADQREPALAPAKNTQFGDFQCNAAMALAKIVGTKPRDAALAVLAKASDDPALNVLIEPLTEASIAGPGFINIRLKSGALGGLLVHLDRPDLGIPPVVPRENVVVDLMGVNLAKQMHVGHLRSPVIGDAIARLLERLGHNVIRQNHVGDWGLNIAMVTARLVREAEAGTRSLDSLTLDDLDAAYKAAQAECQRDMGGLLAAREWGHPKAIAELEEQVGGATEAFTHAKATLVKLQAKDPATHAVWQRIQRITMAECIAVCKRLNVAVTEAHSAGESSYADELAPMLQDLTSRGIAEVDQGALIIRLDAPPYETPHGAAVFEPIKEPCLIRKTDGGYLYATTDIAAVRRRVQTLKAHRAAYCIDARQALHMKQVFAGSLRAGYAFHPDTGVPAVLRHAAFGSVLGEDGKPFKTRSGESVKLADLIEETITRAGNAVKAKNADLAPAEAATIAEAVGIAALKYSDLSNDRARDYMFSFDRMLAFEGNTGPYLLYALVRVRNVFRNALEKGVGDEWRSAPFRIEQPAEKTLAMALLRYPSTVATAAEALEPHRICQFLYDVAGAFSSFYDQCHVLNATEPGLRDARLRLCSITGRVLEDGLTTLGIPTLQKM